MSRAGVVATFAYERICPYCDVRLASRRKFRAHISKKHPNRKDNAKTGRLASQWRTSGDGTRVRYDLKAGKVVVLTKPEEAS